MATFRSQTTRLRTGRKPVADRTCRAGKPSTALVSARDLCKSYPIERDRTTSRRRLKRRIDTGKRRIAVLDTVSLDIYPNEMVAVVGPSGSGKSTLLHCLSGLEAADSGTVVLMGTELKGLSPQALAILRQRHVGFIFQAYNLLPSLRAGENVSLPARLAKRPLSRKDIEALFTRVDLRGRERDRIESMSGGERQRVAIARAIASNAEVIFADEPTGALDSKNARNVLSLLRDIADEANRSVVMVTHDLEVAQAADRVIVLRDGRIIRELTHTTAAEILACMEPLS